MSETKVCSRCRLAKAVEEFSIDRGKRSGRKRICKACDAARSAAYYLRAGKARRAARGPAPKP